MWENANCLQVSELKDLDEYQEAALRKSIVQLTKELLNEALSLKLILLVTNTIIYHQWFPFPRFKSRNNKKTKTKTKEKNKPNQTPPKTYHSWKNVFFLLWEDGYKRRQVLFAITLISICRRLGEKKQKKAFWSIWEWLQHLPVRWFTNIAPLFQSPIRKSIKLLTLHGNRIMFTRT